ncbi:MAG: hypothetical protein CL816_04360 [Coxiellaceae bacterium]|nr:hypothetical protein [Coxiellaceae bacterium]|tara:strand:- start:3054 stop:4103 length:1050 start_codon:yes stop_codon:yes gene_type:complete
MSTRSYIVWDLGGTKCAAAHVSVTEDEVYSIVKTDTVRLTEVDSLEAMVERFETHLDLRFSEADAMCIAGAGLYDGEKLVNANPYPFEMHLGTMASREHWPELSVVHDYTPVICRGFIDAGRCYSEGIITINSGTMDPHGRRIAFGMGTGLGLKDGVMLPSGELWLGHNEMGHIGLSCPPFASKEDMERHTAWLAFLQSHYPELPVSFETVLSGRGLALLHQFSAGLKEPVSPRQVQIEVAQDSDITQKTLSLYTWYLGLFLCTVQLAFMPSGGIWMAGGLVERVPQIFSDQYRDYLQRGLSSSSVYADFRESIPVFGLIEPPHVLLGAAYYAHHRQTIEQREMLVKTS